ncbi:MAG: membrane protein insertase YidC, partial [candidate division WOR-3 bacterium]|nr:membrane protein insertase YidC [candidate division WOR-3 bacterium]
SISYARSLLRRYDKNREAPCKEEKNEEIIMSDTTRLLIAFVLVMIVLFIWQLITPKRTIPTRTSVPPMPETSSIMTQPKLTTPAPKAELSTPPITETEVILENSQVKVILSNIGASIKSAYLKKYQAELIPENSKALQTQMLNDALPLNYAIVAQNDPSVTFQGPVKKSFVLHSNFSLTMTIENLSAKPYKLIYENGLAMTEKNHKDEIRHFSIFYQDDKKTHKITANKVKSMTAKTFENIRWVGLKSKYFATVLAGHSSQAKISLHYLPDGRIGFSYEPANNNSHNYILYLGPIDYDILRSYQSNWEVLADLGWTKIFAIAILKVLKFLYAILKNYGVAIIIFALIMKGIFFPLTRM